MIGLYLADLASGSGPSPSQSASRPLSVSTIERRLSGLAWNYAQRGFTLDRKNRHIATVLAGIKRKHARPPVQKEAFLAEDILAEFKKPPPESSDTPEVPETMPTVDVDGETNRNETK